MTYAQLFVGFFTASALTTVALSLPAVRTPYSSSTRTVRLFSTASLALISACMGAGAALEIWQESAYPRPADFYQAPAFYIPFVIALLLLSAFMLGRVVVKGRRNPRPTA